MEQKQKVMGIFSNLNDLLAAIKNLEKANVKMDMVLGPSFHNEISKAMRLRPSPVRYFTLLGGMIGAVLGLSIATYAHIQWNFITSGKPVMAWIPFVVIAFEGCILLGVLSTLLGMAIKNRMPRIRLPHYYDPRFTQDRFGILLFYKEAEYEAISKLLKESGAEEIHAVNG
jgi:hypothetical protein